ncbi:MAG: hypothetical protein NVS9B15_12640 [Acidobacteriaceae bacterium]
MDKRYRTTLLAVVLLLLASLPAFAQFSASIQGTVTDPAGAIIPNATVTATEQSTGKVTTAQSSGAGVYRVTGLQPGLYTVVIEAQGFTTSTSKDVRAVAEEPRGLDAKLTPAGSAQTVTVNAEATPELQTENASISSQISTQQVENLPQFGGDPYELLRLTPGVYGTGARGTSGGTVNLPNTTGPGGSTQSIFQIENQVNIVANGQRISSNNYMIDGVDVNSQTWGGAAVVTPNDDSVREIHVISSNYSAETGRNSGATVQVITKSGTNRFSRGRILRLPRSKLELSQWFRRIGPEREPDQVRQSAEQVARVRRQLRRPGHKGPPLLLRFVRRTA